MTLWRFMFDINTLGNCIRAGHSLMRLDRVRSRKIVISAWLDRAVNKQVISNTQRGALRSGPNVLILVRSNSVPYGIVRFWQVRMGNPDKRR